MISVIGKGSYGKVMLVKKKDSGQLYALKVLKKAEIIRRNQVEHTMTERRILVSYFGSLGQFILFFLTIGKHQASIYRKDGLRIPERQQTIFRS